MTESENHTPPIERLEISHFQGYKSGAPIEVRASQSRSIGGYAAVFGRSSENLGGFFEKIDPAAFNKSKSDGFPGVVCRWNHRDDFLLGTTRSGTLQLTVDRNGLDYTVDLPECRNDILEMTARGDLAHSSFAFQTYSEDWLKGDSGYPIRMLLSCRLIDVAPVTSPAYPDASCALRSFARFVGAPYEDVVDRADKDELRSFWQRTDNAGPPKAAKERTPDVDAKARVRRESLALAKAEGELIEASITLHDAKMRNQELRKHLDAAAAQQAAAERAAQLAYMRRLGRLTAALDGPLAVARDEARQRQASGEN